MRRRRPVSTREKVVRISLPVTGGVDYFSHGNAVDRVGEPGTGDHPNTKMNFPWLIYFVGFAPWF